MPGVTVKRVQDEGKMLLLNFIMLRTGGDLVTFFKILVEVNQLHAETIIAGRCAILAYVTTQLVVVFHLGW